MESILKLISTESLLIEALDGKATIAEAKKVFTYIDSDFRNWDLNKPGQATPEIKVAVYEMINNATFSQMFGSLTDNLDKLVMSQAQIISFCTKHASWLRQDGYGTFFLIKENGAYFVVGVRVRDDGLSVHVLHLENDYVWVAGYHHRVVAPVIV